MNIENDALKLRKQYQCVMKGWVDLRNLAVTKETYGKVLLQKLQKLEEELDLLYPEHSDDVNRFFCIFFVFVIPVPRFVQLYRRSYLEDSRSIAIRTVFHKNYLASDTTHRKY